SNDFSPEAREAALKKLGSLKGLAALRYTLSLLKIVSEKWMRDLGPALAEQKIDLLLADQVAPGAFTVGEHLGLQTIILCNALAMHNDPEVPHFSTLWGHSSSVFARLRNRATSLVLAMLLRGLHSGVNAKRRGWRLKPIPIHAAILPQF